MRSKREAEKTQPGNPHRLTRRQHILPAKNIERFACNDGLVSVLFLKGPKKGKSERLQPKNSLFCAHRVWDQRSENLGKQIEDRFQELVDRITSGKTGAIGAGDKIIVDELFCLWEARSFFKANPPQDQPVKGCTGIESKDQQEILERNHALFINQALAIPGRSIAGFGITRRSESTFMGLERQEWTIVESTEVEFIAPDLPRILYVPITPTICLVGLSQKTDPKITIDKNEVGELNKRLLSNADFFVFARNLGRTGL